MAIEEKEEQTTSLKDLIELVEKDPIPTNIFTIEDKDPMVILGKLNEVIAYLKNLQATINSSDTKANQALESALLALTNARDSITASTNALNSANKALETANLAIDTANTSLGVASDAKTTSDEAFNLSSSANVLANEAKTTANNAKERAETANTLSANAVDRADEADTKAENAIDSADRALSTAYEANTKAENANQTASTANELASNANQTASTANETATNAQSIANNALQIAQDALNQVVGGIGTKVYDNNGNLKSSVKFAGHNGINVDMADDNETFDIRLDEDITKAIEDNHTAIEQTKTQAQANAEDIVNITDMLAGVEEKVETDLPNRITAVENSITDMAPDVARALKVPMSTPAQLKLIGVNTSNDQEMLNVGNGLEKVNDNLQVSESLRGQVQSNANQISSLAVEVANKAHQTALNTTNANVTSNTNNINLLNNTKANVDLSNVDAPTIHSGYTTRGAGDRVTEMYISSDRNTWYRKWASGWKQCGGKLYANHNEENRTTTYPIAFTQIPDVRVTFSFTYGTETTRYKYISPYNITKSSFSIALYKDNSQFSCWRAEGY